MKKTLNVYWGSFIFSIVILFSGTLILALFGGEILNDPIVWAIYGLGLIASVLSVLIFALLVVGEPVWVEVRS